MRRGFLAQDAPHLQCYGNQCCKHMAVPTTGGLARLKRVARFLKGEPRCVQSFVELSSTAGASTLTFTATPTGPGT
eukprot:387823-Pyramimonas_sp.AAC.1